MEVSELPSLKSLRKLILMILTRDVAHSGHDLKLCSFSVGCSTILLEELYSCMPKLLPTDWADCWSHMEISQRKKPNIPFCACWIRFHRDPSRNFCTLAPHLALLSRWSWTQLPQQKHRPTRPHLNVLEAKTRLFLLSPRVIFMLNDNRLSQFA